MMATILEAKAVISGEDKTGAMFASIEKKLAGLKSLGSGLSNLDTKLLSPRALESLSQIGSRAHNASIEVSGLHRSLETLQKASSLKNLAAGVGLGELVLKANEARRAITQTYREFDKERRYGKAVMGITDEQQEPLIKQAIHGGATSKLNDIQWLEAQRELAARGLNIDQVRALTEVSATIGQAMDKTLPESVKVLEGAMFGFHKDTSTYDAAVKNASRTADLIVKTSKISGMNYDDVVQTYKYGATPFRQVGLSEEQLLAFAAVGKKANMGGDEMGVAARALAANILHPTAGAVTSMLAGGIDYSKYQIASRKPMDATSFARDIAMRYGVNLDAGAKKALQSIFSNQAITGDAGKFMPAVMGVLSSHLGGNDAKSKKSIAGEARRYRDASMSGIDAVRLFNDLIPALAHNPMLANAIFGSKQGGRIMSALGDPTFLKKLDELYNHSEGYSKTISDERMAGFDGAVSRFEGAIKNLETAIGRDLDNGGKGGLLTALADGAARATQALVEMGPGAHQLALELAAVGVAYAAGKGLQNLMTGFGLSTSAAALDGSAAALTAAAARLGTGSSGLPGGGLPGGQSSGSGPSKIPGIGAGRLLPFGMMSLGNAIILPDINDPEFQKTARAGQDATDRFNGWYDAHTPSWFPGNNSKKRRLPLFLDPGIPPPDMTSTGEKHGQFDGDTSSFPYPSSWINRATGKGDGPVTAELNGNVNVTIKVEAASELIKTVEAARSVSSSRDVLRLNTGTSMPEAAPTSKTK